MQTEPDTEDTCNAPETAETQPQPAAAVAPIVASLILLSGGSAQIVKIPGRKQKYLFTLKRGAGPKGKAAHVRSYTDINVLHAEEEDIRATRVPHHLVVRIGEVTPFEAARAGIEQVINDPTGSPADREGRLRSLLLMIAKVVGYPWEAKTVDDGTVEEEEVAAEQVAEDDGPIDRSKREERKRELRRLGEDEARKLVRDEYQLGGIQLLNNEDGLIEAVLSHEESLGRFDKVPVETSAPAPAEAAPHAPGPIEAAPPAVSAVPAAVPAALPPGVPTPIAVAAPAVSTPVPPKPVDGKAYTEAELVVAKIDDLRAIAKGLGVSSNLSRKLMVEGILAKQQTT